MTSLRQLNAVRLISTPTAQLHLGLLHPVESLAMEAAKLMRRRIFSLRRERERGSILVWQLVE